MRNRIGFAILLGFLVGYPFELSSQPITDEEKKLIQEYLEKKKKGELTPVPKTSPLTKMYYTPALYDSVRVPPQSADKTQTSDSSKKEPAPKDLKPFGFDIFNSSDASFAPIPETPVPETYLLGPGDQLLINLWGRADEEYNLSVDREGKIFVPKVGDMVVWGMTVPQFEAKLKTRLAKIYSNFQISVM
ncbi:MAG: polysaccharide biosynthesis/export family protein, partial [Limisphaerales bacterium]